MIKLGREPYVGVAMENTAGTAETAVKYIPFVSCSLKGMQEPIADDAVKGVREKEWGAIVGKKHGEGDIELYVDVENAAYFLYAALGSKTTTTASGETAVWTHTLTRKNTNPPKTLTMHYNDGQDMRKYAYAVINTLELTVSDGLATLSCNILSKFPSSSTGSLAITEERVMAFKDYTVKFGSGATGTAALTAAASASATPLSSFTLRINNNAEAQYLSGSNDAAQISMGEFEVDGEYLLFFESLTERNHYETLLSGGGGTDLVRAMIVTFSGKSIGSAETEEIEIRIPNFYIKQREVDTAASGFLTENPSFTAMYDKTEAKSIQVKITNTENTY